MQEPPFVHVFIKRKKRKVNEKINFQNSNRNEFAEFPSNDEIFEQTEFKKAYSSSTQCGTLWSEHEVNVQKHAVECWGVNHVEGGWPKDISYLDLEQTIRFRKKTEKDEVYLQTVLQLETAIELGIQQNNALDCYQNYFGDGSDMCPMTSGSEESNSSLRILHILREPLASGRAVTSISWASSKKLAAAYCNVGLCRASFSNDTPNDAFVWDVGNCPIPELTLQSPSCPVCVEFNPKDSNLIIAGCANGQVVYWDVRRGSPPIDVSDLVVGHKDCVRSALWLNAKTGTEFFSASLEGLICWWDIRKLAQPTDSLIMDPTRTETQAGRPLGITSLEFEPTMSTKFMVGTEAGTVLLCNSKAKSIQEKIIATYPGHLECVRSLARNPLFPKNFLTVGDWTAKIWSEDVRESHILWSGYRMFSITSGCWSVTRPSVFFTTTVDGTLMLWDLLLDHQNPVIETKIMDNSLNCVRVHDSGKLLACGSSDGRLAVMEIGEEFAHLDRNDKALLTAVFDRETKREKIIEARSREQRLKGPVSIATEEGNVVTFAPFSCEKCSAIGHHFKEDFENELNRKRQSVTKHEKDDDDDEENTSSDEYSDTEADIIQ